MNEIGPISTLTSHIDDWNMRLTANTLFAIRTFCVTDHVAFSCTPLIPHSADFGLVWSMLTFQSPTLIPKSHPSLLPRNVLIHNINISITMFIASRYLNLKVLLGCAWCTIANSSATSSPFYIYKVMCLISFREY
jgi:hypothetical protein